MYSLPCKAKWVDPVKGKHKLLECPLGFQYHLKKTTKYRKLYYCSKHNSGCPVRASLVIETDELVRIEGEHNHDNGIIEKLVKKVVKENFDAAVQNRTITPRNAAQQISEQLMQSNVGAAALPHAPTMKSIGVDISRKRKNNMKCPPIPKSWDEYVLPSQFKETFDGLDFCIMDEVYK